MMSTHNTRAQCPMHQEGLTMDAMSWLVAMELDMTVEASNMPKPWAPRYDMGSHISVGEGTLMHQTLGQLIGARCLA